MATETLPFTPMGAAQLRALAHPLRLQLLQVLSAEGPATASQLGRRLGGSSGATSYTCVPCIGPEWWRTPSSGMAASAGGSVFPSA